MGCQWHHIDQSGPFPPNYKSQSTLVKQVGFDTFEGGQIKEDLRYMFPVWRGERVIRVNINTEIVRLWSIQAQWGQAGSLLALNAVFVQAREQRSLSRARRKIGKALTPRCLWWITSCWVARSYLSYRFHSAARSLPPGGRSRRQIWCAKQGLRRWSQGARCCCSVSPTDRRFLSSHPGSRWSRTCEKTKQRDG